MRWMALLLITVAFAGCTGSPSDPAPVAADDEATEPEFREEIVTVTLEDPVDWSSQTQQGAWICNVPGCPGGGLDASQQFIQTFPYQGTLSRIELELSWTPADATQTGLEVDIRGAQTSTILGLWNNPSTFTIEEDVQLPNDSALLISVWPMAKETVTGTYVDVTQQSFTLTGTIYSTTEEVVQVPID